MRKWICEQGGVIAKRIRYIWRREEKKFELLAIHNAMKYPVAYIQGLPGTGKTNTIINTIVTAFFKVIDIARIMEDFPGVRTLS